MRNNDEFMRALASVAESLRTARPLVFTVGKQTHRRLGLATLDGVVFEGIARTREDGEIVIGLEARS